MLERRQALRPPGMPNHLPGLARPLTLRPPTRAREENSEPEAVSHQNSRLPTTADPAHGARSSPQSLVVNSRLWFSGRIFDPAEEGVCSSCLYQALEWCQALLGDHCARFREIFNPGHRSESLQRQRHSTPRHRRHWESDRYVNLHSCEKRKIFAQEGCATKKHNRPVGPDRPAPRRRWAF
jgi:hypothetical protein